MAGIKITHQCNLRCRHCPFWKKEKDTFSFSRLKDSLKTLYDIGVRLVIIEGGEPFLWRDGGYSIKDAVGEAKKLFFSVGLTTNGTFPLDIDSDTLWVSIDGLKETHNYIRGESFDKIILNIENSSHPNIYTHTTINKLNQAEIPELVRFFSEKVKGLTFQFYYPYNKDEDGLLLTDRERKNVLAELIRLKEDGFPIANSYVCLQALQDNEWKCHSWMIASVEPDGKITQGCYVKGRGEVSCKKCGFSAHTEISLAYDGAIEAIRVGKEVLWPSGKKCRA